MGHSLPRGRSGGPAGWSGAHSTQGAAPGAVLQDLTDRCQQSVQEHCVFSHELLELQQWITRVTQKLESHQEEAGPWDAQSREVQVEVRCLSPGRCRLQLTCSSESRLGRPKMPYWGAETPAPRAHCVCACVHTCVSFRGCWLNSRRRRPSCPWWKPTASW